MNPDQQPYALQEALENFDRGIAQELEAPLQEIRQKSKALANSLQRCFQAARTSQRFLAAYQRGLNPDPATETLSREELLKSLAQPFEEADFLPYREFVRLLRACSLHIGGRTSQQIRDCYNRTFYGERLALAYRCGLAERTKRNDIG